MSSEIGKKQLYVKFCSHTSALQQCAVPLYLRLPTLLRGAASTLSPLPFASLLTSQRDRPFLRSTPVLQLSAPSPTPPTPLMSPPSEQHALVVGAGLVGTLCAAMLASRGWTVTLIESRSDPRNEVPGSSRARSINLALSPRGIEALRSVSDELAERVLKEGIEMRGRMLHTKNGSKGGDKVGLQAQDYGFPAEGEVIRSISRGVLGIYLLDHVDGLPKEGRGSVKTSFETKLVEMDLRGEEGVMVNLGSKDGGVSKEKFDFVVGGDGAYSRVRREMMRGSKAR